MYIKLDENNYIERFELVKIKGVENFIKLDDSKIDFLFDKNKILKKEFYSEYKFYTYKNNVLVKDFKKQNFYELEEQKTDLKRKKEELRQEIKTIDSDIIYYKSQNWDIGNLEAKKQELLTELNSL